MNQVPVEKTGEKAVAESRTRSHRKGARIGRNDERVACEREAMWTNEKAASALEVPQGAAAHPAGTPDDVTARHGTRSF